MSARAVTVIPATIGRFATVPASTTAKKRVAGYARVSTDQEEQHTSYEAQVDFYTNYIKSNDEWTYVDVYADEGISATSTKRREGFNRMVKDALDGKIDLIVTKSVSRFARNTVDTLTTVRQLKEKGVEVYFEKENIYTMDSKGELLITIMSSLAQEESRSISENVTWGQRKRMQDGKVSMAYKHFLGYKKGSDGLPEIVESEAKIVRLIYTMYLQGKTHNAIARHLTNEGIPTPAGKKEWRVSTVLSILKNEKYKGDAILQKVFTVDFLTKKTKINEGEIPQYYVENSHPAVVDPEVYDLVQMEMKKRKDKGRQQSGLNCFSSKIVCGICGQFYGSKVWHSNSKYRRVIWQCNHKYKSGDKCQTPHMYEAIIHKVFIDAFNQIYGDKERLIEDYATIIQVLTDTTVLDREETTQRNEHDVTLELIRKCVEENARTALNQDDYQQRYSMLATQYETAKNRLEEIAEEKRLRVAKRENISRFMADLKRCDGLLTEFDEALWNEIVETIIVHSENDIVVVFRDGSEIRTDVTEK